MKKTKEPKEKKTPVHKDETIVVTENQIAQMEYMAKPMFDQANRKAGIKCPPRK